MRKIFTLLALATLVTGCSVTSPSMAKLTNTATHTKVCAVQPTVAVFADLQVSPTKISYFFLPSQTVQNGGFDNIVNTAVREALIANGNADVLVGLEQQVKYDANGAVESITVSGYPAKYVNFRSPGDVVAVEGMVAPVIALPARAPGAKSAFSHASGMTYSPLAP